MVVLLEHATTVANRRTSVLVIDLLASGARRPMFFASTSMGNEREMLGL
jgi:hypothetical protein